LGRWVKIAEAVMLMGRSTPWSSSGTFRPAVLLLLPGLEAEDLEGEDMMGGFGGWDFVGRGSRLWMGRE
jgi:hypothetical protein